MCQQGGLAEDLSQQSKAKTTLGHWPSGKKVFNNQTAYQRLGEEMIAVQVHQEVSQANIELRIDHSQHKRQFRLHEQIMFDIRIKNVGKSSFSYAPDIFGENGFLVATLFKGTEKSVVKQRVGPVIVSGLPLHGNIDIKPGGISHQPIFVDALFHADTPGNYTLVIAVRNNRAISVSYDFSITANPTLVPTKPTSNICF